MITPERIAEIRAGFPRPKAEYAREIAANHDGYACACCGKSISLRDEAEWDAGESLCDVCLTDESFWEFAARRDLLVALDDQTQLAIERNGLALAAIRAENAERMYCEAEHARRIIEKDRDEWRVKATRFAVAINQIYRDLGGE